MKKIMFNDKYGLTKAVLEGRKTQTRRIVDVSKLSKMQFDSLDDENSDLGILTMGNLLGDSRYKVGEEVAVAQRYLDFRQPNGDVTEEFYKLCCENYMPLECLSSEAGAKNKMFVKADLMPHRIKITNVRVERLQDISDEDCLKEGIKQWDASKESEDVVKKDIAEFTERLGHSPYQIQGCWNVYEEPRHAFADLIEKVSGKGVWQSNPYVFVYDFELIK